MSFAPRGYATKHDLKTWAHAFQAVIEGRKRFEVRETDRDFQVGDTLRLCEWDSGVDEYTGRRQSVEVTYIMPGGRFGLPDDLCVMSITGGSS